MLVWPSRLDNKGIYNDILYLNMYIPVYTVLKPETYIYFGYHNRVGEGTVPLAIVVYIFGSFIKHKIPVNDQSIPFM